MLKIIVDNKMKKLLEERNEINSALIALDEERQAKEKEMNKTALKMQKIKDKTIPIMRAYEDKWRKDGTLGEFDVITKVRISKSGDLEVEILDQIESYKETLRSKYVADNNDSKKEN